jgi:cell wall-associated NlpC family hydrolase
MATIKLFMGILCFAFTGGNGMLSSNLLRTAPTGTTVTSAARTQLVKLAENEIGIREKTGRNDGPRVEEYLRCVGLKKGQPWCAAFVSFIYQKGGFAKPRSGWSPALFPSGRLARSALPGNLIGIYFSEQKRIAHVGIIVQQEGDWMISVEGNTGISGGREGDGVYRKRRQVRTVHSIADWITERGGAL